MSATPAQQAAKAAWKTLAVLADRESWPRQLARVVGLVLAVPLVIAWRAPVAVSVCVALLAAHATLGGHGVAAVIVGGAARGSRLGSGVIAGAVMAGRVASGNCAPPPEVPVQVAACDG